MPADALIRVDHLQHNGVARRERDPQSGLSALAKPYLRTQVAGQAEGTLDAKSRDLARFLQFDV